MAKKETIKKQVKRNREEEAKRDNTIERNVKKGAAEIGVVLKDGKRSVSGVISEFAKTKNFATSASVRASMYAELAAEYQKLGLKIDDWTINNVNRTAEDFWKYAKGDLPESALTTASLKTFGSFSEKYVTDIIGKINPSTMSTLIAKNAKVIDPKIAKTAAEGLALNPAVSGMFAEDVRVLRAAVSTTMAEAAVEGLTNPQMAERMTKKVVDAAGEFRFIDRGGRKWSADAYFGMLNRTLHTTAARDAYIDTATNEAGFDLYTIAGGVTGSSADNPNDPCDMWAGRIFSMTGKTDGYPAYDEALAAGVFHPNCVHFIRVVLPSEIEAFKAEEKIERKVATEIILDENEGTK